MTQPTMDAVSPEAALAWLDGSISARPRGVGRRNLEVFRNRLAGEMYGQREAVLENIGAGFILRRHSPSGISVQESDRETFCHEIDELCSSGRRIWVSWETLVSEGDTVVGIGTLFSRPAQGADDGDRSTMARKLLLVLCFADGLMLSEDVYSL